jgi:hypothetical protein
LAPLPTRLATSAATAATTIPAKSATTESTFGLRSRFIHRQRATTHLVLVELAGSPLRFFIGGHLDESEAAGAAGRCVTHHVHRCDVASATEQLLKLCFTSAVRQIPDVQPATHADSSRNGGALVSSAIA